MTREFNTVGVVGLGTMGAGIVEVFARNGVDVVAVEIDDAALERGRATLAGSTDRAVAKGKLAPADRDALLARVAFAVGIERAGRRRPGGRGGARAAGPQAADLRRARPGLQARRRSWPPTPRR